MQTGLVRGVLASTLLVVLAGSSEAQRRELSFLAGGTYTSASGPLLEGVSGHVGVVTGMTLRLPRGPRIAMEMDFLVVHKRLTGERASTTAPPAFAGPEADFAKLTFIEIPLMFRFQEPHRSYRPVRPYLVLGPSLAVRVACGREVRVSPTTVRKGQCAERPAESDPFAPSLYQDVDVAFHGGVGVEFRRLAVFVRASRSFRSLVESGALPSSPFDGAKVWGLLAGVDYVVRVL